MFQTKYFRIVVVDDEQTVEVCGALKVRFLLFWEEKLNKKQWISVCVAITKNKNLCDIHSELNQWISFTGDITDNNMFCFVLFWYDSLLTGHNTFKYYLSQFHYA